MIQRVERHIVNSKEFDEVCFLSKNLYNYCNFILRQALSQKFDNIPEFRDLVKDEKFISEYGLSKRLTKLNQVDYRSLPAQTSQQVIKLLYKNWKSFWKSVKDYKNNPKKYNSRPKPPKYKKKDGKNVVILTNQQVKLKDGFIEFPKKLELTPLKTKVNNLVQVRVIPQSSCYIVEVVYKKEREYHRLNKDLYLGIDLGLNNLATCIDNSGNRPFIINGKIIKSINQYYNKKKAKLMSFIGGKGTSNKINKLTLKRNCKIEDQLHKTSRFIINYCLKNEIKTIVVGLNKQWKSEINIGKKNNQNFVSIPHSRLILMIKYKAEEVGIEVKGTEESYTSKCDSLALEEIKKQEVYSGRRVKRGLFKSSIGKVINADVNGALNILRKVVDESVSKQIINRGLGFSPYKVSLC